MKVLFLGVPGGLHPWYDDFLTAIGRRYPVELYDPAKPILDQFNEVEVVVAQSTSLVSRETVDMSVRAGVKLWQVYTAGVDRLDVAYFLEKGLALANTPGQSSATALAEHALFLMLCFAKHLYASQENVRSRVLHQPLNDELEGKTLGLIGLGASGRALARRAKAMGMRIIAIDIMEIPQEVCEELQVEFLGGPEYLDRLLAEADYVSIHAPLTPSTRHMIDPQAFGLMKPTSVLINVARGEIVDEVALIEALQTRRILGAGLDVFAQEPLDPTHPLLQLDNVVATPHVAGVTEGTSRRRAQVAAENIDRLAQGLPALYLITSAEETVS